MKINGKSTLDLSLNSGKDDNVLRIVRNRKIRLSKGMDDGARGAMYDDFMSRNGLVSTVYTGRADDIENYFLLLRNGTEYEWLTECLHDGI